MRSRQEPDYQLVYLPASSTAPMCVAPGLGGLRDGPNCGFVPREGEMQLFWGEGFEMKCLPSTTFIT